MTIMQEAVILSLPTALHIATDFGEEDIVTLLLEAGADPNALNSDGRCTPF